MSKRTAKPWTEAEDAILRAQYPSMRIGDLLALLPGRTAAAVKCRVCSWGLKKDAAARSAHHRAAVMIRPNRGAGAKPIGATHRKGRYTLIKVGQPNKWVPIHTYTWEQTHGPVPEGMKVVAIDGNYANVRPENLCLRSLGEIHLRTNANYRGLPEEMLDILHLQNEIRKTIKRKRGNEK